MKIYVDFLGCKLNQAEVEQITLELISRGYSLTKNMYEAVYYLLNSCSVTAAAESKTRAKLTRALRQNPQIIRILIGCCGQKDREEYLQKGLAEHVFGTQDKYHFYKVLRCLSKAKQSSQEQFLGRTRSFVQIQEGCTNFCSYCIVPLLRSSVNSTPLTAVIKTINDRVAHGYLEITLTGTEIGAYQDGGQDLLFLVQTILRETNVRRLRLSSLQPSEITPALLQLYKENERLCPHFHISLQSASNSILKKMNRSYNIEQYEHVLVDIGRVLPHAAVTTDVIVGFPGETEEDFKATLDLCHKTSFARIHVFNYSKRPGTKAAAMEGHLNEKMKKERSTALLAIANGKMLVFAQKHLGQYVQVYVEACRCGFYEGYTPDYLRVSFAASDDLRGQIVCVRVDRVVSGGQGAFGSLV